MEKYYGICACKEVNCKLNLIELNAKVDLLKIFFNGKCQIINEYDEWNVIKMIICDTTRR